MYPYIHIGSFQLGTFGLLLWLGAVSATVVLQRNFTRNGVDADALNVVALATLAGILGAKGWHELQNPHQILPTLHADIAASRNALFGVLDWFKAGFAWFGGLLAAIAVLMWQGHIARPNGLKGRRAALRMLDLAAPAAAIGYGVGRIGCLTSGDGDYGIPTTLPWGVHIRPDALDPPRPDPPSLLVQPTPVYELLFGLALAAWLWHRGRHPRPLGFLTGEYLLLSGVGRFLVEIVRINPKLYWGMSNAQVAALGSVLVGALIMFLTRNNQAIVAVPLPKETPATA